jgi:heme/copper-type cytochrome/quinol oxidase subunit 3
MEAAASAPAAEHIHSEPPEWQPRAIRVGGRLLCGAISFFFASFLFAYFYLRALDLNHAWKIGAVHPSKGLGVMIMALFLFGAVAYRLAAKREEVDVVLAGAIAVLFSLAAIALQFFEYTKLDFGAASGGYAAVFFGWTSLYAIVALFGVYWIWIQIASMLRVHREGTRPEALEGVEIDENDLLRAGIEASSFYWAYYVAIGVLAYIVLYIV